MAVRVAELERRDRTVAGRQQLWATARDPHATQVDDVPVGGFHVGDHDRAMLEPGVRCGGKSRVRRASRELEQLDALVAEREPGAACGHRGQQPGPAGHSAVHVDDPATERVAVEAECAIKVRRIAAVHDEPPHAAHGRPAPLRLTQIAYRLCDAHRNKRLKWRSPNARFATVDGTLIFPSSCPPGSMQ